MAGCSLSHRFLSSFAGKVVKKGKLVGFTYTPGFGFWNAQIPQPAVNMQRVHKMQNGFSHHLDLSCCQVGMAASFDVFSKDSILSKPQADAILYLSKDGL